MENIRLISILPLPSQGVQQPSSITQGGSSGAPGILVNLPSGSILSGFIVNRDNAGNPVLRTESGDVTFHSDIFLKIGSEVVIRLENRVGGTLAHILSINGQPPESTTAQSARARPQEVIVSDNLAGKAASTQAPAGEMKTQPTVTVTGTLLSPPPRGPAPVPPGTQITFNVTSLTTSPTQPAATPAAPAQPNVPTNSAFYAAYARTDTATPATPAALSAPAIPAAPSTPAQAQPASVPASPAQAEIPTTTAATPTTPAAPIAPPVPGQAVPATVIGNEPTGEAIVQTPLGIFRLQPGTVMQVGSKLNFEITQVQTAPIGAAAATASPPASLPELATRWESLQQIFTLLAGRVPLPGDTASGFVVTAGAPWLQAANAQSPPMTGQTISSGLMLFIAALKGGDIRNWLGKNNTEWLEGIGRGDLLHKAQGEFMSIARQFTEAPPQQWQSLFFPVAVNGDWQQVRMFTKRERRAPKDNERQGEEDTRFVIEMDLSQMGEIQMDGFVQRQEKSVDFNLFIRSFQAIDPAVQRDILGIYNDIGELTGYKGTLLFQTVKEFPVHPMEEAVAHALGNIVA